MVIVHFFEKKWTIKQIKNILNLGVLIWKSTYILIVILLFFIKRQNILRSFCFVFYL